ncbi:MAG: MlaD family protein [Candidatus Thiodiazotropha sp.]
MSNRGRANPSLIGAFVLAILLLGVGTVFLLSKSGFSSASSRYILYFQSDIKGLQVGSPVNFRGVKIGQVESMSITYDSRTRQFRIPVVISIDSRKVGFSGTQQAMHGLFELNTLIREGLRARLNLQSLVTGKQEIELDFAPDTEPRLIGGNAEYPEIPTVQSNLEKIASAFDELPMERITRRLSDLLDNLDKMLANGEGTTVIETFIRVTQRLDAISAQLDKQTPALLEGGRQALDESRTLMRELTAATRELQTVIHDSGPRIDSAFASWDRTMASGEAAFDQIKRTAGSADAVVRPESPLVSELSTALRELSAAARSIRLMSEYLERHPDALLRGKQQ